MKFISPEFPGFACDCIERLYKRYLFWENKYQAEALAHTKTKRELAELKDGLQKLLEEQ